MVPRNQTAPAAMTPVPVWMTNLSEKIRSPVGLRLMQNTGKNGFDTMWTKRYPWLINVGPITWSGLQQSITYKCC